MKAVLEIGGFLSDRPKYKQNKNAMSCSNINNAIYSNSADEAIMIFRQTLTLKISGKSVKAKC